MKTNVCIIGPLPPPMNGNSKAIETLLRSTKCKESFNMFTVNLSGSQIGMSGKFSFRKVNTLIRALNYLKRIQKDVVIDTYYLTIAQTSVGCMRDIILLRQIFKYRKNSKVILHLHGGGFRNFINNTNPLLRKLIKKYYSKADTFIVLSESLKPMFDGIAEKESIKIVGNCVDDEFIFSNKIIEDKINDLVNKKRYKIVYLSNMIKSKGYLDVLHSVKELVGMEVQVEFLFAGNFVNNNEKVEFENYITVNNLNNYVSYLGVVSGEEKKRLLLESDIFILPTYYPQEGQPISILEAMAAGMPIITTFHGGIPDIIKEKINGIYVSAEDSKGIAYSISEIVKNTSLLENIARNNREAIIEKHLEKNYVQNMIDILKK